MTYEEYKNHLKVCEYLGKEPAGDLKEIHDFLSRMWDGMEVILNSGLNEIFILKDGELYLGQNHEDDILWCHRQLIWSFFSEDMRMGESDIQDFIRMAVKDRLRTNVGTPHAIDGKPLPARVERYLKRESEPGTPRESNDTEHPG